MKPSVPRKAKAAKPTARSGGSRAAILRAAEHLFAEKGLEGARTEAIAAAAGVNKALLYYYFKSKDDLYLAILEGHMKDFCEQASRILAGGGPADATVLKFVSMHFDFMSARPDYPRLVQRFMLARGRPFERLARKYSLPVGTGLQGVIERGLRRGEFYTANVHHTAITLTALTSFYFAAAPVLRVASRVDPYDPAQLALRKKEVLAFIRRAMFRKTEANT